MSKPNYKRIALSVGVLSVIVAFGFQFLKSSTFVDFELTRRGNKFDDIDTTYLKLFKKFKEVGLKNQTRFENRDEIILSTRDPFVRPDASFIGQSPEKGMFEAGELRLNGILWESSAPSAVISGKIVQQGSQIGPYKVAQIKQNYVILRSASNEIVLEMSAATWDGREN